MHNRQIRVGLVRMDSHTMYIGILMEDHDPMLLRGPMPCRDGSFRHGWQAGGTYLYFYTTYREPAKMTVPPVEGFEVVKVWDEEPELAELAARVFRGKPKVCRSLEELSDDVDLVVIGDCKTEGHDHLKLASPGLRKRVPTYIDKPLAYCLKDAREIASLAAEHGTPILSLSILRESPGLSHFRNRLAEIEPLSLGMVFGAAGTRMDGLIHAVSTSQHVFGSGVRSVRCMGDDELRVTRLDYDGQADKPAGGVLLMRHGGGGGDVPFAMYAAALGRNGAIQSAPENDYTHPYGMRRIVERMKEMVQTGRSPVPIGDMLENMAVCDAIRAAFRTGKPVEVAAIGR